MVYKNANICQQFLNIPSWSKNSIENGRSLLILRKGMEWMPPADECAWRAAARWRPERLQSNGQGIDFGSGASASGAMGAGGAATQSTSRHQGWGRSA